MQDELPREYRSNVFLTVLVVVGGLAIGFAWLIQSAMEVPVSKQVGKKFPPIEVDGWFDERGLDANQLRGKVILVDAWAFWCGPCRMATPMLLHLYEKYKDQQVVFVGLTPEGDDPRSQKLSLDYIASEKIPWPNGYGASRTLSALKVDTLPQFWVLDRQNRIVTHIDWGVSPALVEELERGLIQALKSKPETGQR